MPDVNMGAFSQPGENPLLKSSMQFQQAEQLQMANQAQALNMRAQQALGPIMQSAVDPNTGDVDFKKVILGVAKNPDTAFLAPSFIEKANAQGLVQKEMVQKELQIAKEQQQALGNAVSALLPKGAMVTKSDMINAAADLRAAHPDFVTTDMYNSFVAQLSRYPDSGPQLHGLVKQIAAQTEGASKALDDTLGGIEKIDTGPNIAIMRTPKLGAPEGLGVVGKGLTPEKSAELVTVVGPTGEKSQVPYGQLFGNSGQSSAPAGQKAGEGGASSSPPPPGVQVELGPIQAQNLKDFGEAGKKITEQTKINTEQLNNLDQIEHLMKGYHTGLGAAQRTNLGQALLSLGVSKNLADRVAGGNIDKGLALRSVLVDFATGRMRELLQGGGRFTNIEFQAFQNTKPNIDMTEGAIKEALQHFRRGVTLNLAYAKGYNWHVDHHKTPGQFNNWWIDTMQKYSDARRKATEAE